MNKIIGDFCIKNDLQYGVIDNKPLKLLHGKSDAPFSNYTIEERINPILTMESCKSIIVFLMPYKINTFNDKNKPLVSSPNMEYDYHNKFKSMLEKLIDNMLIEKSFEYKIIVDTGKLIERELAVKANLGYYGKNTNLINEKYGSSFFIGYIMIDFKIDNTNFSIENKDCGTCNLCVNICPTNCIVGDYTIDSNKCLSYLTQKKGDVDDCNKNIFQNKIYGCNECVKVCPHNAKNLYYNEEKLEFYDFLNNTNKQFKEKFKDTGFYWRGNNVIKRNAMIAKNNANMYK